VTLHMDLDGASDSPLSLPALLYIHEAYTDHTLCRGAAACYIARLPVPLVEVSRHER
jgi:hypothetical protein